MSVDEIIIEQEFKKLGFDLVNEDSHIAIYEKMVNKTFIHVIDIQITSNGKVYV